MGDTYLLPVDHDPFGDLRSSYNPTPLADRDGSITTGDVLAAMPQPSWHDKYIKPWGSASLAQQEPNWFGRNVLGNVGKVSESLPSGVGDAILAGLMGPRAPRATALRLGPNLRPTPADHPWQEQGIDMFHHDILRDGEKIGSVSGNVNGDTATIGWFGDNGLKNKLGPSGLHTLVDAFREMYPGVTTFEGGRVSGARTGTAADRSNVDHFQSLRLPADAPRASLEQAAPRIDNPIRAYHGSPHDFDKFDLSKIGSGEGAQAYGHGLYFAEHEPVARGYRNQLTEATHARAPMDKTSPEWVATDALMRAGNDRAKAIQSLQSEIQSWGEPKFQKTASNLANAQAREAALAMLNEGKGGGSMYEVAIHATPEQFLDWDKPLSGQPVDVTDKLRDVFGRGLGGTGLSPTMGAIFPRANREVSDVQGLIGKDFSPRRDGKETQSLLNDAGIPGIKYLDQGSRGAGQGTSNYVVWSPEIIEIIRKYGLAGAAALPPAVASAVRDRIEPVDHDPFAR